MILQNLNKKNIILGSASPRRKELLAGLCINFTINPQTSFIENQETNLDPYKIPETMAIGKSEGHVNLGIDDILITADTIVICNNIVLGKPANESEAVKMLGLLSNHKHTVATGVCIRSINKIKSFTSLTDVWFKQMSDEEINFYVDNYKPYDKAGAYGVQEWIGYIGITKIEGSFYNVMGLPIQRLYEELLLF